MESRIKNRGFASMSKAKRSEVASKGGRRAHELGKAHVFTTEEAIKAGKKGGAIVSKNKKHMAKIGKKGGSAKKVIA